MPNDVVERMNFFQFQQVGAEDFRQEQLYHRDARARDLLGARSWGIVQGCEIVETEREGDPGFVDIKITVGSFLDGFGRVGHVLDPIPVPPELFSVFNSERLLELWIHYHEELRRTEDDTRANICIGDTAFSRVVETHRLIVGSFAPERDPIILAGDEAKPPLPDGSPDGGAPILPPDMSMPAQDFPDPRADGFWPVRLGSVRWDGTVGKFRPVLAPEDLRIGRVQAGFIGGSLLGEGGTLRIAPRLAHPDGPDEVDFATIEGRVQIDGSLIEKEDIFLHGGMVSFQALGGSDETVPLTVRRVGDASGTGADLRVQIGADDSADNARMTVGTGLDPYDSDPSAVVMSIRADAMVDLPNGPLRALGTARQAIEFGPATDADPSPRGIGWQGRALYQRSGGSFYWYHRGSHEPTAGDPGTDGAVAMRLTGQGGLEFEQEFRQIISVEIAGQSYGIGAQDDTLYFRSDRNFAWYRGGGHDDARLSNGGGATAMWLNNSSRLTVEGGVTSNGRVQLNGQRLDFRDSNGNTEGDPIELYRHRRGANQTDLRARIGDDSGGGDRFVVGRENGAFTELFWVDNQGDAELQRDLRVRGDLAVDGPVTSAGVDLLLDVQTGEVVLDQTGAATGTFNLPISSTRVPNIGSAQLMVGLSDIGNVAVANNARWRVHWDGTFTVSGGGSTVTFPVEWRLGDSDGQLFRFSYVAILMP